MKPTMIQLTTAALAAFLVATAPASAQLRKPDGEDLSKRFAAADKDGNGQLTVEEAKAGMPRVAENFDKIDKDKKGFVTLDQIKSLMPKR